MKLTPFSLDSDTIGLDGIETFSRNAETLRELILNGPGKAEWKFHNRQRELRELLVRGGTFESSVRLPEDLTHLLNLWIVDDELASTVPFTRELLAALEPHITRTSTKHIRLLARIYLERFDRLPCFSELGPLLCTWLWEIPEDRRRSRLVQVYAEKRAFLFAESGPDQVAKRAADESGDIYEIARKLYIPCREGSRFFELARPLFLMRRVQTIPIGADDPCLVELQKPQVKQAILPDRMTVAHRAAIVLLDRLTRAGEKPTAAWISAVLGLLGDPRRDRESSAYKLGWGRMRDDSYRATVGGWLSEREVNLFIRLLEESCSRGGMSKELLEARRRYLQGLLASGLISNSVLLLSEEGAEHLADPSWEKFPPNFLTVAATEECFLYLNVGGANVVEGEQTFGIRVYRRLLEDRQFDTTNRKMISREELERLQVESAIRFDDGDPVPWQIRLIDGLGNLNVTLSGERVLSSSEWERHKPKARRQPWAAKPIIEK